jgi:hypothetical protein
MNPAAFVCGVTSVGYQTLPQSNGVPATGIVGRIEDYDTASFATAATTFH